MLGLGVVTALLVAGVVVTLLRSQRPTHAPPPPPVARAAPFTFTYRRPWHPVSGPVVGSAALSRRPLNLAFGYATLAAGKLATSSPIPGGVPPALLHYGRRYKAADTVVAGGVGREYTWSMPGGRLVAYVMPLRDGDAAVICRAPRADGTALRSCGLLARTAQLSGVEVVSHGPDTQLEHTLRATLEPVASARSSLDWPRRTQLKARAARAARVAGIESDAWAALANLNPPPRYAPAVARLRAALTDEAAGLTSLAKAARSDRRVAYTRATTQVSLASTGLHTATRALSPYQLGVSTLPIVHLAALPPVVSHPPATGPATPPPTATTPASSTTTPTTSDTTPTYTAPPSTTQPATPTQPQTTTPSSPQPKSKQLGFS